MALNSNEMLSHTAVCKACGKKKKGIILDDDQRYEACACGGELGEHEARMQRMDDTGIWKEVGSMRWDDGEGRWVPDF